jgi:myo-inositol-1(or 4)-monophosphatase
MGDRLMTARWGVKHLGRFVADIHRICLFALTKGGFVTDDISVLLEVALEAAEAARRELQARVGGPTLVDVKGSQLDFVTDADTASQSAILEVVHRRRGRDQVVAEEQGGGSAGDSGYVWAIDPLDGTTNFVRGYPDWSASIGVLREGRPVVGVVVDVLHGRTYAAALDRGARCDGTPMRVSPGRSFQATILETGFSYLLERRLEQWERIRGLMEAGVSIRSGGSAALSLARVAGGVTDAYLETDLSLYDWVAGAVLVTEAGGEWSTATGTTGSEGILAGSPRAHDTIRALLAEPTDPVQVPGSGG